MKKEPITQEELKSQLYYNPATGVFIRHKFGNGRLGVTGSPDSNGHTCIYIKKKKYKAHRLAFLYMTGSFPEHPVYHLNRIKDDNRWENLRAVTPAEIARNRPLGKNNTSGYCGVHWERSKRKWEAQIRVKGKTIRLGDFEFEDIADAVAARKAAEKKYDFHPNHGMTAEEVELL